MKIKQVVLGAYLIALFAVQFPAPAQSQRDLQRGLEAMLGVEGSLPMGADPDPPIRAAFTKHFGKLDVGALEQLSDEELKAYFSATHILSFFSKDIGDLALMEAAFEALEARKLVSPVDLNTMYGQYVAARAFEPAAAFAARYPDADLERLPRFGALDGDFRGPTVMELGQENTVSRVEVAIPGDGPYVVVAAHPLCHFSENAVRAIEQDPELANLFAGRTLWLMPQDGHLNVDVVREWNRQFPDYTMRWAWRTSDWPMIKRWATPNFYFYRDGKLVDTVIGWPPEGQREALLSAFEKIGARPAEAH